GIAGSQIRGVVECELQQAMRPVQVQFVANVLTMVVHGAHAEVEGVRYLFAGVILADQLEDTAFGSRQGFKLRFAQEQLLDAVTPSLPSLPQDGTEKRLAPRHVFERSEKVVGRVFFDDISDCAK